MDAVLYQHDDGRHAVAASAELATFAVGEPAWHRVGPVEIVGTPAAPSDAMLQVENAGLQSSVGHLGALVDELRGLLRRAIAAMSALHSNASPIDESSGDLDARIPAGAFRAFVDEHAALMYEQANGAAAPPLGPLQVDAGRRLAHMWLTAHYSDAHSANEIERVCWEILKPGDLSERPALSQPAPVQAGAQQAVADLHPATADLVSRFSAALADKLLCAQKKYGYSDGWLSPDWMDECRAKLLEHIAKGDPRDVAAYCAFLWHYGEKTFVPTKADPYEALMNEVMACGGEVTPREIIFNHATFDMFMQSRKGKTALDFFADDVESSLAAPLKSGDQA